MSTLASNALDEDRFVHRARQKGIPITMFYVDSEEVSGRGRVPEIRGRDELTSFCLHFFLQPVPSESPNKAALAKVDQKLLQRVQRVGAGFSCYLLSLSSQRLTLPPSPFLSALPRPRHRGGSRKSSSLVEGRSRKHVQGRGELDLCLVSRPPRFVGFEVKLTSTLPLSVSSG